MSFLNEIVKRMERRNGLKECGPYVQNSQLKSHSVLRKPKIEIRDESKGS